RRSWWATSRTQAPAGARRPVRSSTMTSPAPPSDAAFRLGCTMQGATAASCWSAPPMRPRSLRWPRCAPGGWKRAAGVIPEQRAGCWRPIAAVPTANARGAGRGGCNGWATRLGERRPGGPCRRGARSGTGVGIAGSNWSAPDWPGRPRGGAGEPLASYEVILKYIETTESETGFRCRAVLDTSEYPTRIQVTEEEKRAVRIRYHKTLPQWNYTIYPRRK